MLSTSSLNSTDQAVVDRAVELLRVVHLTASDQLTIEHAIGLLAITKNCTRARAAQILHKTAFPN